MEKRTLLAVILSLLVLYIYSMVVPKPEMSLPPTKNLQIVDNKEDTDNKNINDSLKSISLEAKSPTPPPLLVEKLQNIETKKLSVDFSNIGGAIKKVVLKEYDFSLPVTNITALSEEFPGVFTLDKIGKDSIQYSYIQDGQKIVKQYSVSEDDYLIHSEITVYNLSEMSKKVKLNITGLTIDLNSLDNNLNSSRDRTLYEYSVAKPEDIFRKSNAFKFSSKEKKEEFAAVDWLGFRDRYFCAIVKPQYTTERYFIDPKDEKDLSLSIQTQEIGVAPGNSVSFKSITYAGPQKLEQLASYDLGFEKIMRFSGFWLFNFVSTIIYKLMVAMNKVIPNWGICIILTSLAVYGLMYPLTIKGMLSMKRMQSMQPKIAQLKEQHKNNPQKLNKEIMEIYKTNKINPLGGCFPFLLQMPLFIGLYQVLWRSVAFKGANFLWIKDLSEPDRLMMLPFHLPFIGNELNILPICMMIAMAIQQRISSKNMTITDSSQAAQQKMMMVFFPIFLGVIFYKFASGLSLYFTTFYSLSIVTQLKMSKMAKAA